MRLHRIFNKAQPRNVARGQRQLSVYSTQVGLKSSRAKIIWQRSPPDDRSHWRHRAFGWHHGPRKIQGAAAHRANGGASGPVTLRRRPAGGWHRHREEQRCRVFLNTRPSTRSMPACQACRGNSWGAKQPIALRRLPSSSPSVGEQAQAARKKQGDAGGLGDTCNSETGSGVKVGLARRARRYGWRRP